MKKKGIIGFLTLLFVSMLVLAACSGGGSDKTGSNTKGEEEGDKPEEKTYQFRLAETHPIDYPTTKGDIKFAELVEERSNGRIKIDVFPSSQLGEEKSVIEQVQLGAIEFTRVSSGPLAEFNSDFGVFSLPYIFDNDEHTWNFLNGDMGTAMLESLQESKFMGLAYYSSGSRNFYSSKPLNSIEDVEGLKIRVQQNTINMEIIDALGANATPMPYGEVYSGLQTGVIDGAENNHPSYFSAKHYEVAPNYILDGHQRVPEVLLISKKVWDELSAEDQELIKQAALDSVEFQRAEWDKYEKEALEGVKKDGATVVEVDDLTPWQEKVKPVIDNHREEFKEVLDAIDAARK
ncbi:TRAP transporter substrate-binding protein [Bacillus sp. JJ1562]|uniref:TRAP transporter substrate-binding protein n=1 Tax=Bacillus sp. JJ1562 TaxID=3122960 RepID=UPI003002121B